MIFGNSYNLAKERNRDMIRTPNESLYAAHSSKCSKGSVQTIELCSFVLFKCICCKFEIFMVFVICYIF